MSVKLDVDSVAEEETRTLKLSYGFVLLDRAQKDIESPLATSSLGVTNHSSLPVEL